MKYLSVSDTYTPSEDIYDSIESFMDMCKECFGEAPSLRCDPYTGNYYSDDQLILKRVS